MNSLLFLFFKVLNKYGDDKSTVAKRVPISETFFTTLVPINFSRSLLTSSVLAQILKCASRVNYYTIILRNCINTIHYTGTGSEPVPANMESMCSLLTNSYFHLPLNA